MQFWAKRARRAGTLDTRSTPAKAANPPYGSGAHGRADYMDEDRKPGHGVHACRAIRGAGVPWRSISRFSSGQGQRLGLQAPQHEVECRALTWGGFSPDTAAVARDNFMHSDQANAGSCKFRQAVSRSRPAGPLLTSGQRRIGHGHGLGALPRRIVVIDPHKRLPLDDFEKRDVFQSWKEKRACFYFHSSKPLNTGGADGTRTRDPRRDRPVF